MCKNYNKYLTSIKLPSMSEKFLFVKLAFAIVLSFVLLNVYAQNPLNVESVNLYKHGTNSHNLVGPVAGETKDSVTTGSVMKYYIPPDTNVNPGYTGILTGTLKSSFNWTTSAATGSASGTISGVTGYLAYQNYKQITWSGIGTINFNAQEISDSGCASGTTTTVPVVIIAVPTVAYSRTDSGVCVTQADGSVNLSLTGLPINWTSSVSGIRLLNVNVTITCTNALFGGLHSYSNISVTETGAGKGTFNLPVVLNYYGSYTITLTAINDRISTKSVVNGTTGVANVYTFLINKTPVTGPAYHVPNQ